MGFHWDSGESNGNVSAIGACNARLHPFDAAQLSAQR